MPEALRISVIRPDDLLNIDVTAVNLRVDAGAADTVPVLVPDDPQQESLLVVTFPPQTIVEEAFFEQPAAPPPVGSTDPADQPPPVQKLDTGQERPATPNGPPQPRPAGEIAYRIGERTRLAFRVPPGVRLEYSSAGLLDWSALELVVTPVADVPAGGAPPPAALTIRPPTDQETTLQLPFRLHLSPTHQAGWQHASEAVTHAGRTELWHTRLVARDDDGTPRTVDAEHPIGLRAIWSPDYLAGQHVPGPTDSGMPGAIAAMNTADRHQIVVLTSAFTGYAVSAFRGFVPSPIDASMVLLSPLGGWLRSAATWDPPTLVKPRRVIERPPLIAEILRERVRLEPEPPAVEQADIGEPIPPELLRGVAPEVAAQLVRTPALVTQRATIDQDRFGLVRFDLDKDGALDLSQWTHVAAQGRDHYVRLVYEGTLSDIGHRASLVKVSERRFETVAGSPAPIAFLRQYMYVVVREPERTHTARNMMFKKVRLTTLVTPHIDYPYAIAGGSYVPPGRIAGSDRSFWITVGGQDFVFHGIAEDANGNTVDFAKPLIFVPNSETAFGSLQTAVTTLAGRLRMQARIPGQRIAYAEADPAVPKDNTSFVTEAVMLGNAGATRDTFFEPNLFQADVHIPAVEALTGATTPTKIAFAQPYVDTGFADPANRTGAFARIVTLNGAGALVDAGSDASFQAAQAGGFATPQLAVTTLTRGLGPLGGTATAALANTFDPKTVFDPAATIFGVFSLADLLPTGAADTAAPRMQVRRDGAAVVTELDWSSPVSRDLPVGIVTFHPLPGAALTVHAEIRKDAGAEASTHLHGTLGPFDVVLLASLAVHFRQFDFDSRTGAKTAVDVQLDDAVPVSFIGDLSFVEELRKLIPPGVFGNGVSIDLITNPLGVKASLTIALPPATIGVFALKNIAFSAGLTIPFLDGKPVAEFGFARRDAPFLLAVLIFGGGGFFHVEVDTDGLRMLEAAFEFGATAALDIGVASGEVHIMAGIYFKIEKRAIEGTDRLVSALSGYLRCGGSLSVLGLVRISVEFYLSFTYYPPPLDKAKGRATLTVEVQIACFSKSIELTVERSIGGKGGDPTFTDMMPTADVWAEYADAFA